MTLYFEVVRTGSTRTVILTKNYAIKIPNCQTWRTFLKGLLANDQERDCWRMKHPLLCPVLFALPTGLFIVMPRARNLTHEEWLSMDIDDLDTEGLLVEKKIDSWGKLDGRFVAVDYGNL
ncbi:MAG: hypothetical protein U5K75_10635 [Ahrensia sp.]|nr:hypothetical protein [Ahrensia sp.]